MTRDNTARKEMDMQAMMDVYHDLAIPTAVHKLLSRMEGSWDVKSICWFDSDHPVKSSGTCEQTMVLDGRFLHQEFVGEMMGSHFRGIGYLGYDNHKGKYVSTWMDTMGSGIYYFEGSAGNDGRSINLTCSYDDPVQGPGYLALCDEVGR